MDLSYYSHKRKSSMHSCKNSELDVGGHHNKDVISESRRIEILNIKKKYHIESDEMLKIQKIQRRVRAWLLKRQKFDIESASELLHSAFLSDHFKKKAPILDEKDAAILI